MTESTRSQRREVRKAVIPAAGLGTRFSPATKAQPKEMLPVVDKPAIQCVVEEAVAAGIRDLLVITARGKESIEDHFDRSFELEHELEARGKLDELKEIRAIAELADVHFVRQGEARGLGHAVSMARQHIGDEPFAVLLGDDIMVESSPVLREMVALHARTGSSVVAAMEVRPDEISSYGCIDPQPASDDGLVRMRGIVEKPSADEAPSNLAVMGRYVFTPEIFEVLERVAPGKGGEIQLTDGIAMLLETQDVLAHPFREGRYDTGKKADYIRANVELALERPELAAELQPWLVELVRGRGWV